jgi:predicted metal-binding membrane protein
VTAAPAPLTRPMLRTSPQNIAILAVAAVAWAGLIAYARHMGNGVGTMGMPIGEFLAMWSLMMAAMMLPAVAPVASLYVRSIRSNRTRRLIMFVGGYLIVWAAVGIPAYFALRIIDDHVVNARSTMRIVGAVVLATGGVYQLTPIKAMCLRHCRSPLGQLLHYGNFKGRTRELRVAVHHASFCLGCCWALMAMFFAFGIMNVWAMLGLTAIVISEKLLRHGETIGRLAGAAFVVLALLVAASPRAADAILPSMPPGGAMTDM